MNYYFTPFIFCFFLSTLCRAQHHSIELDPVTVTSSLSAQKSSETGRNIFILKGDLFNTLPVHSLDELLRYIPGIEVQARGPMGSQADIIIRGGTFQQVLLVLDGIRLNDPVTGHFNAYIPIAPSEIERIEVLKGAASAIYGSEAVGGVIHVITKSFAAKGKKNNELSASTYLGEYSLVGANMGFQLNRNKSSFGGGFLSSNSNGQPQRGTRGFFNNHTASLSFNQKTSDFFEFSLRTSFDDRDFSAQNFYTSFVSDTARERVKTFWNQARLVYNKEQHRLSLGLGYKNTSDHYAFNSALSPNKNKSNSFQSLLLYQLQPCTHRTITGGLQFQHKNIRSNDRGNHERSSAAAFINAVQNLNSFTISPALRWDWDERGGSELVPQINLSYKINNLQFRASGGKTIRGADFTERFNNYNKTGLTSGSIGNPELEAERSFSYEGGMDILGRNLKLSLTAFNRNQKNLIDWVLTPYDQMPRKNNLAPGGQYALASNIAKVNTLGLEGDLQYTKTFKDQKCIWTSLGLTWLSSESTRKSFYISSHANFLANFNLQYASPKFVLSLNGVFKDREPREATQILAAVTEHYFLLNTKAEYRLWQNRAGIFVQADNLLDTKYQDLLGAQMPGRWLMTGFKINIM